ncbi:hypothetical protein FGO68_gene12278 [Halteria grandinella]|uniref:Uncharacterized protein n=1 Tax=Halteria grandinella TaxID=5974 RepID=A0A8J8P3G0_HALGN|nr:hypothetical protein FGO68_gene12278 [Halteria grandinella]
MFNEMMENICHLMKGQTVTTTAASSPLHRLEDTAQSMKIQHQRKSSSFLIRELLANKKDIQIPLPMTMHRLKKDGVSPLLFYNHLIDNRRLNEYEKLTPQLQDGKDKEKIDGLKTLEVRLVETEKQYERRIRAVNYKNTHYGLMRHSFGGSVAHILDKHQEQDAKILSERPLTALDGARSLLSKVPLRKSLALPVKGDESPFAYNRNTALDDLQHEQIESRARVMLAERRTQLSHEMREKYKMALEKYRKRFLRGYVDVLNPPKSELNDKERRDLKKESNRFLQGLIKQREGRIMMNVKQSIQQKSRGTTNELSFFKFIQKAEDELIADTQSDMKRLIKTPNGSSLDASAALAGQYQTKEAEDVANIHRLHFEDDQYEISQTGTTNAQTPLTGLQKRPYSTQLALDQYLHESVLQKHRGNYSSKYNQAKFSLRPQTTNIGQQSKRRSLLSRGVMPSTPGDFSLGMDASNKNKYEQLYVEDFTLSRASAQQQVVIKEFMDNPIPIRKPKQQQEAGFSQKRVSFILRQGTPKKSEKQ